MNQSFPGWDIQGELPSLDFDATGAEARDVFDEDIIQLTSPSGRVFIDVGWYPAESAAGAFQCRLVEDDAWDEPREVYVTRQLVKVEAWIESTVNAVSEREGQPGAFKDEGEVVLARPAVHLPIRTGVTLTANVRQPTFGSSQGIESVA